MKKNYFFKIALLFFPLHIFSQLSITQNDTATILAEALEGSGVTITNATLNCGAQGSGKFSYLGSDLGLTNGIILTTGHATDASNAGTYFCDVMNGNIFSDPDLISIDPDANDDVCILQFDAVPDGDTMFVLNYVFGSEEYPMYVGSFNDAFGFFFTGPNPAGGNYSSTNIATLPNGSIISINNVNDVTPSNPSFFHNNYTAPNSDIAYDGYTIPMTSYVSVTPYALYHIKIAIADALDEAYDSGVFLTQSSFASNHRSMTTSINSILNTNSLHVFPNPTNGILTVRRSFEIGDNFQLAEISSGRVILSGKVSNASTQIQIDMTDLSNGVYNLNIQNNTNTPQNIKVIKVQ